MTDRLTSSQRAQLRSLAHPLKPVQWVGREGVTEALAEAVRDSLSTRELLKVKVQDGAPETAREAAAALAARIEGTQVVQVIGRTLVLYRRHPDDPEIELS